MFEVAPAAGQAQKAGGAMLVYRSLASTTLATAAATVWGPLSGYVPSCPLPSGEFYAFLLQASLKP